MDVHRYPQIDALAYLLFYFTSANPCMSMHEAKLSRAKVNADNRRTEDSILRAAISSASYERTSRPKLVRPFRARLRLRGRLDRPFREPLQARSAISSAAVAPRQTRSAISSAPAAPRKARVAISSAPAAMGQARAAISSAVAAPRRARAAISSV